MKTIPQVREELLEVAQTLLADDTCPNAITVKQAHKIENLVKSLHRRTAVRRSATEHSKVTPVLAKQILTFAKKHPKASYAYIGTQFNVAIGRVSEVVAGKRAA